jgi:N6-adenosine-specific RNA methylase IME4
MFDGLPRNHFGAILADPPWQFVNLWNTPQGPNRGDAAHYCTMTLDEIAAMPVRDLAADDCVLFMWGIWILMPKLFPIIEAWGFTYKTCAFDWMKADVRQADMFKDEGDVQMGLGYWTRANTEPCLLATRGKPKRLNADVRQGIIAPRREHSRKPDGIHERIERLVAGPYLELFARQRRPGWTVWGNQVDKFAPVSEPVA